MVEALLLSTVRIKTFCKQVEPDKRFWLFFSHAHRLFLVSSRHVFFDEPSNHKPDRIAIDVHIDTNDLAKCITYSIPLYRSGASVWREAADIAGGVDVAVVEIELGAFPSNAIYAAFSSENICDDLSAVEIGSPMLIVGYPLGFHDTLHRLPVARHAINASTLSFRFQGMGYFLTDARTHRGTSGACVVMRSREPKELPLETARHSLRQIGRRYARLRTG